MSFFNYLKAVATGPKSNRDLTFEEGMDAFKMILEQTAPVEQTSAFLMCLRVKLESQSELQSCLDVCTSYVKKQSIKNSIELGYSYDGRNKLSYLFPLFAKYLNILI